MEDCRKAKRLVGWVEQILAESDILDSSIPIDTVLEERFDWKTIEQREALRNNIIEFRAKGEVDWKKRVLPAHRHAEQGL